MSDHACHQEFSQLIARHQSEIYAYIFAIVRNWEDTDDLFQSVCVVLWRKFGTFRRDTSFFAWARQIAQFEVRKFLARKQTPTCVNSELLDALAETASDIQSCGAERSLDALLRCREKLNAADEELLELRYVEDLGSRQIADQLQRPQTSVCRSLNRIRNWLLECIERELDPQEQSGRELP